MRVTKSSWSPPDSGLLAKFASGSCLPDAIPPAQRQNLVAAWVLWDKTIGTRLTLGFCCDRTCFVGMSLTNWILPSALWFGALVNFSPFFVSPSPSAFAESTDTTDSRGQCQRWDLPRWRLRLQLGCFLRFKHLGSNFGAGRVASGSKRWFCLGQEVKFKLEQWWNLVFVHGAGLEEVFQNFRISHCIRYHEGLILVFTKFL